MYKNGFVLYEYLLAYQKILSWEPLLELVSIDFVEEERKNSSLTVGDSLAMKIVINYNGPKVSAGVSTEKKSRVVFLHHVSSEGTHASRGSAPPPQGNF